MATLKKVYSFDVKTEQSGNPITNVSVILFDVDETKVLDVLTDTFGEITTSEITASTYETPGMTEVPKNPHDLRVMLYGKNLIFVDKSISIKTLDTFYLADNPMVVYTPAETATITGVTLKHTAPESITIDQSINAQELYAVCHLETINNPNPQKTHRELFEVNDTINATSSYELVIDGATLSAYGSIKMSVGSVTLTNLGKLLNINVRGIATLNYVGNFSDWSVGTLAFNQGGTYTLTDCAITSVENNTSEPITINLMGSSSIGTNLSPGTITIQSSSSITLTQLVNGCEVRIRQGSYTLDHVQDVTGNQYQFVYDGTLFNKEVKITIGMAAYDRQEFKLILLAEAQTLPIELIPSVSYI